MSDGETGTNISRRELLATMGKAAAVTAVAPSFLSACTEGGGESLGGGAAPLVVDAGPDRVVIEGGRTYLSAWAGYMNPPWTAEPRHPPDPEPANAGPDPVVTWSKASGPGDVLFEDENALRTAAMVTVPGAYTLQMVADNGDEQVTSTFNLVVEPPPPVDPLDPVFTTEYHIDNRLWGEKAKALIVNWIPHLIDVIERDDVPIGEGGIYNFVEAGKALRGEPHGEHRGRVFANAWVHQTVESMCLALMYDARGDEEILAAQARMRETLTDWIPTILAAQEPDGYLHTAYTLRTEEDKKRWPGRWTPEGRAQHEGYVAGYFIESAINHFMLTGGRDRRLYDAAKKLADLWVEHIGPPPKQEWWDGHQEMEQALVRFGHFVNEQEGGGRGDSYIGLARFLLDCRRDGIQFDQSHVPSAEQYEAVGHAVRAAYQYSAMSDVAIETRDIDYQSAVRSLWLNMVHKKVYVTGGIGSGETFEGFGPEYALPNDSYCESCSSCGAFFFHTKMNRIYKDAQYADVLEETLYNALLGSTDLEATHYYYDNPLDADVARYQWHRVPCCVGNIPRTILMLPTWMYAKGADGLYVNLFVGSTVTVHDIVGTDVEVVQETEYPWDGKVAITVNPAASKEFGLRIRVPNRGVSEIYTVAPEADGITSLAVNGSAVRPTIENGYAVLRRTWRAGDRIELEVPLRVQRVHADERVEANRGRVALKYGPLIYNIEAEDQDIGKALPADSPLTTEWRGNFLGGMIVIRGTFADGSPMLAIPNYARYNRVEGTFAPPRREAPREPTSIVWMREV